MTNPWTCPRCSRIWAPTTKGCEACNAAVEVARMHGFVIDPTPAVRRFVADAPELHEILTPTGEALAREYAPWLLDAEDRRLTVVGGSEHQNQNAAEYLDRAQRMLRNEGGDDG